MAHHLLSEILGKIPFVLDPVSYSAKSGLGAVLKSEGPGPCTTPDTGVQSRGEASWLTVRGWPSPPLNTFHSSRDTLTSFFSTLCFPNQFVTWLFPCHPSRDMASARGSSAHAPPRSIPSVTLSSQFRICLCILTNVFLLLLLECDF